MAARTVDLIASGPPASDPFAPAAPAWSIARAFSARGDRVQVLYPEGGAGEPPPGGVVGVAVPVAFRRPGALMESADFTAAAARRVRSAAELVLRDPLGLGPLGLPAHRGGSTRIVALVRSMALAVYDRERAEHPSGGFADRLGDWSDRRAVRRLERSALAEADLVFVDAPEVAEELQREYALPDGLLRPTVPPVPVLPDPPAKPGARGAFGIPPDVPVVLAPFLPERTDATDVPTVLEAFHRIRPLFPGIRLLVVGADAPTEPGVIGAPGREAASYAMALAAADVVVVAPQRVGFDPRVVLAQRSGLPTIGGDTLRFPTPPGAAVRTVPSSDAGELASVLAELIADPVEARKLGSAGREYARAFDPDRIVDAIEGAVR